MGLHRVRNRLPLVVFILLLVLALMLLGFACACFSDNPMQAIERALAAVPSAPALIEVWSFAAFALLAASALVRLPLAVGGPASPAVLQRFRL